MLAACRHPFLYAHLGLLSVGRHKVPPYRAYTDIHNANRRFINSPLLTPNSSLNKTLPPFQAHFQNQAFLPFQGGKMKGGRNRAPNR